MNLYRQLDGPPLLLDINYLTGFLRTELAQAASRILQSFEKPANRVGLTSGARTLTMSAGKNAG